MSILVLSYRSIDQIWTIFFFVNHNWIGPLTLLRWIRLGAKFFSNMLFYFLKCSFTSGRISIYGLFITTKSCRYGHFRKCAMRRSYSCALYLLSSVAGCSSFSTIFPNSKFFCLSLAGMALLRPFLFGVALPNAFFSEAWAAVYFYILISVSTVLNIENDCEKRNVSL